MKWPFTPRPAAPQAVNLFPNPRLRHAAPAQGFDELFVAAEATARVVDGAGFRGVAVQGAGDLARAPLVLSPDGVPLKPGITYTISAHLELDRGLAGVLAPDARRIVVSWKSPAEPERQLVRSDPAPNLPGDTRLSVTASLPDDASDVTVEFVVGAGAGRGSATWSRFSITASHLLYDFFDGDSAPTEEFTCDWAGTPGASPSVRRPIVSGEDAATEARLEAAADRLDAAGIRALLQARPALADSAVGAYAAGVECEDEGHVDDAVAKYRDALTEDGSLWGPRHRLALRAVAAGRLSRAVKVLEPVAGDPRTPALLLDRLSTKLHRAGRIDDAARWARWGVERHPLAADLDVERMMAARPVTMASRLYVAAMVRDRLHDIRERAARSREQSLAQTTDVPHDQVFVFWAQGFDAAPAVVQACHRRLVEMHPPGTVVALTLDNLADYVDVPSVTTERTGSDLTAYSDTIRLELLKKYGGYWVDATCWVSAPVTSLASHFAASDFFAYQINDTRMASWFMGAPASSHLVHMLSAAQDVYWETHDHLVHYFVIHALFEALVMLDPECARWWEQCQNLPASVPHRLQWRMFDAYSPGEAQQLKDSSVVHKLTYKFDQEIPDDSNLAAIIRGDF